ncbi:MAG: DUF4040 domain-containing protein [Candidatus Diapherotrites archaeon]|nr:DUF4040 domain-containing protein [Candidatus Diapherotrites archaeon]
MMLEAILMLLIVASALLAVRSRDLLFSAASLAVLSLGLSLEYYVLQAPDVAISEAAVGAALTTAILVLTIQATSRREEV